jgi:hypothetical protein
MITQYNLIKVKEFELTYIDILSKNKFLQKLINILIKIPCNFIILLLLHFSLIFYNYTLLLMGKNEKKYTKKAIIISILIFIIFFIISYLIGIPRLYVI